ncbi:unnamed protein product [Acanthocheilonema viteae]|uniref:Uncharacterized protein n=1 Tax=Acanthocheilonema viteae TaxID=6277 RepID=A0A498SI78_ACAVI|nr:unnamed protein product [Acanthocheilonema viteae]
MLNFRKTRTAVTIAVVRYADNQLTTLPPANGRRRSGNGNRSGVHIYLQRWQHNDDDDDDDVWHEGESVAPRQRVVLQESLFVALLLMNCSGVASIPSVVFPGTESYFDEIVPFNANTDVISWDGNWIDFLSKLCFQPFMQHRYIVKSHHPLLTPSQLRFSSSADFPPTQFAARNSFSS